METTPGRESRPFMPPRFPYDPNRSLTYERHGKPPAWAEVVGVGASQGAAREARLGAFLAWFSIGLGVAQLLAPRAVARATGLPNWPLLLRAVGARELACGVGLLARPRSALWRWSRVAGDTMDVALIGAAVFAPGGQRRRLAATAALAAGIMALDLRAGASRRVRPSAQALPGEQGRRVVRKAITINRSPAECYSQWRNFERFPSFMRHIEAVEVVDQRRSHWRARAVGGRHVEWDAELTDDQPDQLLAWRSVPGSQVDNSGSVRFSPGPGGKGTELEVEMQYQSPPGAALARLFGEEPAQQVEGDLRRFKQLMETGDIATTAGQSHGPRTLKARLLNKEIEP
jgi:uncharacterized membrane protein